MDKIITRKRISVGAFVPVRIDKNVTVKDVVDDILKQNNDIEVNWLDDGSAELIKEGDIVGTICKERSSV